MNQIRHSATSRVTTGLANCPKGFGGPESYLSGPSSFLRIAGVSLARRNCAGSCLGDDLRFGCERAPETGAETGSSTAKTPIFWRILFLLLGVFFFFFSSRFYD